jgi:hypothetical protein
MELVAFVDKIFGDPALKNIYCDVSWDETAKFIAGPGITDIQ